MVQAGEQGEVVRVDEETGEITIRLDRHHKGLSEWHNTIWIIPPDEDGIGHRIRLVEFTLTPDLAFLQYEADGYCEVSG